MGKVKTDKEKQASARGKRSSDKGSRYERFVAGALSSWITDGLTDDAIWRSSMSGGRTTLKNRKLKKVQKLSSQAGDFDGNTPEGIEFTRAFYCDSKHFDDLKVEAWVYQKQGRCVKTIDTVWREAAEYGRIPLGMFKEDQRDHLVLTSELGWSVFDEAYRTERNTLRGNPYTPAHGIKPGGIPYINQFFREIEIGKPEKIYVLRWACFQAQVSWAMVREVLIRRKLLTPIREVLMHRPVTQD